MAADDHVAATTAPRADSVSAAAQAAQEAADIVLARSNLWLVLHPIRHRRLRRDMLGKRDILLRLRASWHAAGRPV